MYNKFILLPPPNLTGNLHVGHILNFSINYFVKRYREVVEGTQCKVVMGFDHSALYAEIVAKQQVVNCDNVDLVIDQIRLNESRYKSSMIHTMNLFGFHYEENTLFTFSEKAKSIVKYTIDSLRRDNLIYRSNRIYKYDCQNKTVISNVECSKITKSKKLYRIKYKISNRNEYIHVCTTTLWNLEDDRMILVSPDSKFAKYNNMFALNIVTGIKIPVVVDDTAKSEFGTGAFKVTPIFSKKDFDIYKKYFDKPIVNDLFKNNVFTTKSIFKDMSLSTAISMSESYMSDAIVEITRYQSIVNVNSRTNNEVYEVLGNEYVLDIKSLYVKHKDEFCKTQIYGYDCEISNYIDNLEPWCITRQNNYGHSFDEYNVLDTWFSSSLMSIIMQHEYCLHADSYSISISTGYDIMFFWIFKMICMSTYCNNHNNIGNIYSHGLICDSNKNKISKSKGNSISVDVQSSAEAQEMKCWLMCHRLFKKYITLDESKKIIPIRLKNKINNILKLLDLETKDTIYISTVYGDISINIQLYMFSKGIVESINSIYEHTNFINKFLSNVFVEHIKSVDNRNIYMQYVIKVTLSFMYMYMEDFALCKLKLLSNLSPRDIVKNIQTKYSITESRIIYYFMQKKVDNIYLELDDKLIEGQINLMDKHNILNISEEIIGAYTKIIFDKSIITTRHYKHIRSILKSK